MKSLYPIATLCSVLVVFGLGELSAGPVGGSAFVARIRVAPIFTYKDGSGRELGEFETICYRSATIAYSFPSVTNTGPLYQEDPWVFTPPPPSTALNNDLYLKAQAGDFDPANGVQQLVVNLEGEVNASLQGGLLDLSVRIIEVVNSQTPPKGKSHAGHRWIAELLGVDFPQGSWVSAHPDSHLDEYAGLPTHDPSTQFLLPNSPAWQAIQTSDGSLPEASGGTIPCDYATQVDFRFEFDAGPLYLDLLEMVAMRWVILFEESTTAPLILCFAATDPIFANWVIDLERAGNMDKEDAGVIITVVDDMKATIEAANKASGDEITNQLARLLAHVDYFQEFVDGIQRKLDPAVAFELNAIIEDSRSELVVAQDRFEAENTDKPGDPDDPIKTDFVRGDPNSNGRVEIADASYLVNYLFFPAAPLKCQDAADANDDGRLNIADSSYIVNFLFLGGSRPPTPYPGPGKDTTDDVFDCKG